MLDIYATSVDYTPNTEMSQQFFATVQNKMHWVAHGQTAAEVIHDRIDAAAPHGNWTNRNKSVTLNATSVTYVLTHKCYICSDCALRPAPRVS